MGSKLVSISSPRAGYGKTTIAGLVGFTFGQYGYKTLMVDNTLNSDLNKYLRVDSEYCSDDLKPYIASGCLTSNIITSLAAKAEDNIDVVAGTRLDHINNVLTSEEIEILKESATQYDIVLVDVDTSLQKESMDILNVSDHVLQILMPNETIIDEYYKYLTSLNGVFGNLKEISTVVLNGYSEDCKFDMSFVDKFTKTEPVRISHCPQIFNFTNGYKFTLSEENKEELKKLKEIILGDQPVNKEKKQGLNLKNLLSFMPSKG